MNPSKPDTSKEKLYEEFTTVVAETEQLLKSVTAAGGDKAGALKAGVADGIATAAQRLGRIRDDAAAQASAAARSTHEYVQENPWQAVGVAAAFAGLAGLLAGILIARR
jgi:ElaB/YqjD/DUF883 family membrane-anchored ribosome-binding protein